MEDRRSSSVMPPSPVVELVPMAVHARPIASLALAPSAPKLMPATVIGILSAIGFAANRSPSTTSVSQRSR